MEHTIDKQISVNDKLNFFELIEAYISHIQQWTYKDCAFEVFAKVYVDNRGLTKEIHPFMSEVLRVILSGNFKRNCM